MSVAHMIVTALGLLLMLSACFLSISFAVQHARAMSRGGGFSRGDCVLMLVVTSVLLAVGSVMVRVGGADA